MYSLICKVYVSHHEVDEGILSRWNRSSSSVLSKNHASD